MFADLAARAGTPVPVGFAEIVQLRLIRSFESELVAMPGIGSVLSAINSPVCVASSSAPERLRYSLSLVGLLSRFDPHIFSATQVAHGKPAPDLFLFAAAQMGVEARKCLVIEQRCRGQDGSRCRNGGYWLCGWQPLQTRPCRTPSPCGCSRGHQ